ncbi:MAG: ankyrin repeat domain-containing protein [Acidobacteria bacterium]|nr:ankyrin repeat domain-containing protein [Acidobacteriota bacterium]
MKKSIQVKSFSSCSEPWDLMQGDGRIRTCRHCRHAVHHLDQLSTFQIKSLVRRNPRLCVRFRSKRVQTLLQAKPKRFWRLKRGFITGALIGQSLFASPLLSEPVSIEWAEANAICAQSGRLVVRVHVAEDQLAGATGILENSQHHFSCQSNEDGYLIWPEIPPGSYSLSVSLTAFRPEQLQIAIEPGQELSLEVGLEIETAMEGIIVVDYPVIPDFLATNLDIVNIQAEMDRLKKADLFERNALFDSDEEADAPEEEDRLEPHPLFAAIFQRDDQTIQQLIQAGSDPNLLEQHQSVLQAAIVHKCALSPLLDLGATPNLPNDKGIPAWFYGLSDLAQLRLFIDFPVQVDQRSGVGQTALMFASGSGELEALKILLKAGAKPSLRDAWGYSALDYALVHGQMDCATVLNNGKLPPGSYRLPSGIRLAHWTAFHDEANLLLSTHDLNLRDVWGRTPLMLALLGNPLIVEDLIEGGADLNVVDRNGRNVLHYAAVMGVFYDDLIQMDVQPRQDKWGRLPEAYRGMFKSDDE